MNAEYLRRGKLKIIRFGRGVAWLDTGTPETLLETSQYFATVQHRQGIKVACLEEVAYRMGYIDAAQLKTLAETYAGEYRVYLMSLLTDPPGNV